MADAVASSTPKLTREQIAAVAGGNPRAIKLLENLIKDVSSTLPAAITAALEAMRMAGSFADRSAALSAAAAGEIPASVQAIITHCHTTAQDGGGALYARVSPETLQTYGLSTVTVSMVSFPDASGDFWLLDEENIRVAMVGGAGQVLGVDPGSSAEDQGPYFNAAMEFGSVVKGGATCEYDWKNYYIAAAPKAWPNIGLRGPDTQGRDPRGTGGDDSITSIYSMPGPVLAPGVTWLFTDNNSFRFCTWKRSGMTIYSDLSGALDFQVNGFAGVALAPDGTRAIRGLTIADCNFYGFAYGLQAYKTPGARIYETYGDCVTLVKAKDSGETLWIMPSKRKPVLSTVAATRTQEAHVLSVFDSGGKMGCNLDEDITGLLRTGERVGNNSFPDPYDNVRSRVTVLSATSVQLDDIPYSAFTVKSRTSIGWQPGCSSALVGFYNAGGFVGVQTVIDMPFQAGHKALVVCATTTVYGFWSVKTRVSGTDFVIDVPWDAGLGAEVLAECELTAMPNERVHSVADPDWGTVEGFGIGIVNCDGVHLDVAMKGGSGIYCDCSPSFVAMTNEGGTVGSADTTNPLTRGLVITQPHTAVIGGATKSTGTGVQVVMDRKNDNVCIVGHELVDGGRASFELITGGATLLHASSRGPGRTIFSDISYFLSIQGELVPEKIRGTLTADIRKTHWIRAEGETCTYLHSIYAFKAWNASGAQVTIGTGTSDSWLWSVPVTSTPKTAHNSGAALALVYPTHHEADISLGALGSGFTLDATTVPDGFRCRIRNVSAVDKTLPTSWGSGVTAEYALGAAHTKLKAKGWLELVVRVISGSTVVYLRGDTA